MSGNLKAILTILAAILVLSTAVAIAVVPHDDVDRFETTIIGFGSFDDYMVDLAPRTLWRITWPPATD
jgi:hypothetical protein